MDENTQNRGASTSRAPRILGSIALLVCAIGAGALFGFVTQSTVIGVIAAVVLVGLSILWTVRSARSGDGGDGTVPLEERRRERGKNGAMDQPGTSGIGTPGI
jgi:hypothetical protein